MIYETAFSTFVLNVWGGTKYEQYESKDITFKRALSCFILNDPISLEDRNTLMYEYLKTWFGLDADEAESLLSIHKNDLVIENDFIKKILMNYCAIYTNPITREIENDEILNLLDIVEINDVIHKAHILARACGEIAVRPIHIEGEITFQIITPDYYRIETELNKITKFTYAVPVIKNGQDYNNQDKEFIEYYYHIWTDEKFIIKDTIGNIIEDQDNQYRFIPFEILRLDDFNNYDFLNRSGGSWDLISDQLRLNAIEFLSQESEIYGTIGFWILRNLEEMEKDNALKIGAGRFIRLQKYNAEDPDPEIEFLQAEHKFDNLSEHKERILKNKYKLKGLPTAITGDNKEMSGKAMELDRIELNEIRNQDKILLKRFDNKLVKKLIKILNIDSQNKYVEIDTYPIKYEDNQVIWDKKEYLDYNLLLLEKNLINYYDLLRNLGYDGSNEELKNILEFNKEVNNADNSNTDSRNDEQSIQTSQFIGIERESIQGTTDNQQEVGEIGTTNGTNN